MEVKELTVENGIVKRLEYKGRKYVDIERVIKTVYDLRKITNSKE